MLAEARDIDAVVDAAISFERPAPYGAVTWNTALAVAEAVRPHCAGGVHVLDVGVGTGLVACVAALHGAAVTGLDIDEVALELAAQSARANACTIDLQTFDLTGETPLPKADVVVFADVLYEPELAVAVAHRVREAIERKARVFVGDPGRDGREAFKRTLAAAGIAVAFERRPAAFDGEAPVVVGVAEWTP